MAKVGAKEFLNYMCALFGDDPKCELSFSTDIECLVAIILSAQCTDKRVNMVTKDLFKKYKTAKDFANADQNEFERDIYSTGFYRNKAKNIIAAAKAICNEHNGRVPTDFDTLTNLAGVGRKTAGVFTVEFLKKPAMPVDTHVTRVARRLGLTKALNATLIERDLKTEFEMPKWGKAHLYMVLFGRYFCTAKKPKCDDCKLREYCNEIK